jgi:hypothetical protein
LTRPPADDDGADGAAYRAAVNPIVSQRCEVVAG